MSLPTETLWKQYTKSHDPTVKEQIIMQYANLVKFVAGRMMISLPPSVEIDDLESAGIMGLIDAVDRFDQKYGVKFESYAIPRIKGSMLDELRKLDWVPRSIRSKTRELEKVIHKIEGEKGGPATDEEISRRLIISLEDYFNLLKEVSAVSLMSLDGIIYNEEGGKGELHEVIEDKEEEEPDESLHREELKELIIGSIDDLLETERLVIALYYYEELTLKEIGQVL